MENARALQPKTVVTNSQSAPIQPRSASTPVAAPAASQPVANNGSTQDILYTCASCQFQTSEEDEFMKHARTDHRTDLSMWCKQCGKCFSNAGVLVSHIKERACIKEEMQYKCGVKDCVFETNSGQTFVHHLRHCHKGSPFIFCVHCQKIFTLPHCLILHMQDDCPFKDRNRRSGTASAPLPAAAPKPPPVNTTPQPRIIAPSIASIRPQTPMIKTNTRLVTPRPVVPSPTIPSGIIRTPSSLMPSYRGRGRSVSSRGRGRGRGRARISDSSDSEDDADDPSWRPEESLGETGLRRSARWAKKVNDIMNPEPSTSGVDTPPAKKSFTQADINSDMISCPCCDFMAAFQSVLEDHYIANHKAPNKNSCMICKLKFENTRAFLDHFEEHRKGTLPVVDVNENAPLPKQIDLSDTVMDTDSNEVSITAPEVEPYDGVLTSIGGTAVIKPLDKDKNGHIPYQAQIHDKNLKDSKLKKFEELKSPNDLITMKTIQKLKHFFKCGLYSCSYTTDDRREFASHLKQVHEGKRYHCCYCLTEELNSDNMAIHIALKHNKQIYQCSKCFYRAYSKAHVQIHIKNGHTQDPYTEILPCEAVDIPDSGSKKEEVSEEKDSTTWPYVCAIGECKYINHDPKEFKKHNEISHRNVSVFYCHYCKVDFLTFKRLMNHYRLHGLNVFQCNYCVHGTETNEEMMMHLCNCHADEPLRAYMRGSQEEATSQTKLLNSGAKEELNGVNFLGMIKDTPVKDAVSTAGEEKLFTGCENELYHIIEGDTYPEHMRAMCFPRYLKATNLLSGIICGVSLCNDKLPSLDAYTDHLEDVHKAQNFPCPHCPEVCSSWTDLRNHLLCHGSRLYACGVKDCEFYYWNKDGVRHHKKEHKDSESPVVTVREVKPCDDESKLTSLTFELTNATEAFTCLFCKYKCSDKNTMKNHMYKEMAYQRFDCSLCEKKCLSRKEIKDHFIASHSNIAILCSVDYNVEIENMVKQILLHQEKFVDKKLTESCDMCCRKFKNHLRLQSHLYICLQKEYRPYECQHCNKSFVSLLALKYHTNDNHHPEPLEYNFISNSAIEDDTEKNLLKVRLKQLRDIFEETKLEVDTDEKSYKVKFYSCTDCPYEAYHKFNVEKHNKEKHDGNAKVIKGRECKRTENSNVIQLEENSNDGVSGKHVVKRYSCGYCVKKMITIQEVEKHIRKSHSAKNKDCFYYFCPDTNSDILSTNKDIYECAYCKSTRENLIALKKHADLMHSEMEFKVRGFMSSVQSRNNYLACGYCYKKVDSPAQLQEHSTLSHPLLALKSIGDYHTSSKNKRTTEVSDDFPNKRVKFNAVVYTCCHCGGVYSSVESVSSHTKKAHSRFEVSYKKLEPSASNSESSDLRFYKCEFCRFVSEKDFLEKHLATKHKMRVTCSYCNKKFEFASKLKEHHDVSHKGLPFKLNQENVTKTVAVSNDSNSQVKDSSKNKNTENKVIPEPPPVKKPELAPELRSIIVHMQVKEGKSADVPLVKLVERLNVFPVVILKDCGQKK